MKTACALCMLAWISLTLSAQDYCPCMEASLPAQDFSWNQSQFTQTQTQTAFVIPESSSKRFELRQERQLILDPVDPARTPEEPKQETKPVSKASPTPQLVSIRTGKASSGAIGKQPNPRFKKKKRKRKRKYKGRCPRL